MDSINITRIKEVSRELAERVRELPRRYFLNKVEVGKEPRIKVLRGFRGLGKTTALLQLMNENAMYISMDHALVKEYPLYDTGETLIRSGFKTLLIDEIQHYPNWKQHTKSLYDSFPDVTIILSGSAPLAFEPERRYEIIEVEPLSLSEFASLNGESIEKTDAWQDIDSAINFAVKHKELHSYYAKYLDGGAFPLFFSHGEKTLKTVYSSIEKSIKEDAIFFGKVDAESIVAMEKLLLFLASASLGEVNMNSLSNTLDITKYKVYEIVKLLEGMRILRLVRPYGKGAKLVRGDPKLIFYHPVMRSAVCNELRIEPDKGAIREELAVFCFASREWNVNTIKGMKRQPDYVIEKGSERIIVEIGGPSKKRTQLKEFSEKTIVITDQQLMALACF